MVDSLFLLEFFVDDPPDKFRDGNPFLFRYLFQRRFLGLAEIDVRAIHAHDVYRTPRFDGMARGSYTATPCTLNIRLSFAFERNQCKSYTVPVGKSPLGQGGRERGEGRKAKQVNRLKNGLDFVLEL